MKINVLSAIATILLIVSACGERIDADDDSLSRKFIENMRLSSVWLIEEGIRVFSDEGIDALKNKLIDDWAVQMWVDPHIEDEHYLALFRIKARGINRDIYNLYRTKVGSDYYEFWLVKVMARSWSGDTNRSEFYIARTNDLLGNREIIEQSNLFMDSFLIDESKRIEFPIDNPELIYDMKPWQFPESYQNTVLENKRVTMDVNGRIFFDP